MHFFSEIFVVALKTQRPPTPLRLFRCQNKTKFLFFVHTITEAKQSNRQGGARAVDLPVRSFDLARPGVASPLFVVSVMQRILAHR